MIDHELCKGLCVLAASGQLGETEREMLASHCLQCRWCREHLTDLSYVGGQLLLHAAPSPFKMPEGSLDRFRTRAVREGIPMRRAGASGWLSYGFAPALVMAVVLCAVLGVSVHRTCGNSANAVVSAAGEARNQPEFLDSPAVRAARPRRSRPLHQRVLSLQGSLVAPSPTAFAAMRARGAVSSSSLFAEAKPSSDASLYPALSGTELRRLDLFRASKEPLPSESFGIASLECPAEPSAAGCSFDFASNIRQLRFQISTTP